jgi:glutathione peroxidase
VDWHQYKDLEAIYKEYKDQNFVIIGFPPNFGSQEPGTNEEIAFCQQNYGGNFSMMDKVSVRRWYVRSVSILNKSKNGLEDSDVAWNFKIPNQWKLEKWSNSASNATDASVIDWIKA